ncbi:undecaprenyl-diphosphate phosphatase [Pseudomonas aeruginosa]|uniref:undecaprenyl-diphosphate phosphatase n=1 Tax=Pseudomonas aeruginosa TaxID=287 RepID=UPI00191FD3EA|nr:undecaprenyl-diphosphate phosphatase [Pseudomonas aeruginosa]MBX6831939.1 undecaprenyl-diphosphate phosphatase [Pseudomonas aeruginosa]MCZ9798851.1 undecaprenyl-diphosphate phosphatase [Pseudomonas aeruginosa]QQV58542.1 undecaprenyl-diphosphate phosphatase [Pseudomonas aeruginosa]
MEWWTAFQAFILGVVEGLTEFLPISSTGHQIIVADLIGFGGERAKAFNIIIQLAAILAVVWEFRGKIFQVVRDLPSQRQAQRFTANLLIAFFPAVVLGVLFADLIHEWLFNPITVALALVVGGVVMLWAERRKHVIHAEHVDDMTWKDALKIGCAQCLAMPTMVGAAVYSGYKYRDLFRPEDLPVFAVGFVTSFVFAMVAVRALLKFIGNHSYAAFAWYRIAFGLLILATWQFHLIDWSTAGEM